MDLSVGNRFSTALAVHFHRLFFDTPNDADDRRPIAELFASSSVAFAVYTLQKKRKKGEKKKERKKNDIGLGTALSHNERISIRICHDRQ